MYVIPITECTFFCTVHPILLSVAPIQNVYLLYVTKCILLPYYKVCPLSQCVYPIAKCIPYCKVYPTTKCIPNYKEILLLQLNIPLLQSICILLPSVYPSTKNLSWTLITPHRHLVACAWGVISVKIRFLVRC